MKRTNRQRLRWIASLMIVTQVLLLLFLGKWLDMQYREQKATLKEKLEFTYEDAFDNVFEANIVKKIDNLTLNIGDTNSPEVHYKEAFGKAIIIHNDSSGGKELSKEKVDSLSASLKKGIAILMRNVLIKSSDGEDSTFLLTRNDSSEVRHVFEDKLKDQNIKVKIAWTGSHDNLKIDLKKPAPWSLAYISDYNPFLLQKITPQILFSLLLFLLCGAAFLLSYNTMRKQYRLNLQKDDFINNMSHELKTPVATAKVAIEALQKFDAVNDPKRTRDYLEMAAWEMDRLDRLVANVMNNVQMESGSITMLRQPTDLNTLLKSLCDNMQPLFVEKHKSLIYQSDMNELFLNIDAVHVQGAIYNILDNALKYGGDTVALHLEQQRNKVLISISDNGQGIPEEYRQKIFEKFFRIPSGNVHNIKGYGLGLNYVNYVITAHDGYIMQENNPEGGANFTITLPAGI